MAHNYSAKKSLKSPPTLFTFRSVTHGTFGLDDLTSSDTLSVGVRGSGSTVFGTTSGPHTIPFRFLAKVTYIQVNECGATTGGVEGWGRSMRGKP